MRTIITSYAFITKSFEIYSSFLYSKIITNNSIAHKVITTITYYYYFESIKQKFSTKVLNVLLYSVNPDCFVNVGQIFISI